MWCKYNKCAVQYGTLIAIRARAHWSLRQPDIGQRYTSNIDARLRFACLCWHYWHLLAWGAIPLQGHRAKPGKSP